MAYEHKPNEGSLFLNKDRTEDKHANARGSALIGGVEYWVDAWTNTNDAGAKWQKLRFKPKDKRAQEPAAAAPEPFSDDIPF
jgi:hypothetical protein